MRIKGNIILAYMIIILVLLMAGCDSTDPNETIINDIKSNFLKTEATVTVEENEIVINLEISDEEDNEAAYNRLLSVAGEIKSKYDDKQIYINLLREGSSFGVINF